MSFRAAGDAARAILIASRRRACLHRRREARQTGLLEVRVVRLHDRADARALHDVMPPERRPAVAGELHGVVAVHQVRQLERDHRILVRAVLRGGADLGNRVGVPAVERDALVGGAVMAAPQFQVQVGRLELREVLLREDLHHAAALDLFPRPEHGMQHGFRRAHAEPLADLKIAGLLPPLIPVQPQEPATFFRHRTRGVDGLVLVEQHARVAPADGDDVHVAVAVDVHHLRAVMVLVAG